LVVGFLVLWHDWHVARVVLGMASATNTTERNLLRYLAQHGHDEAELTEGGSIRVIGHWTKREPDGSISSGSSVETIAPTWRAVRLWLGY